MSLLQIYGLSGLIILGIMILLWILSLILKDASIVDIFWGTGFVITNWVYFALTPDGLPARKWLIGLLVSLWGLRLSLYILRRNWGKGEDFRYQKWRQEEGQRWWWFSFFKVFLLQGVLMWIISIPLLAAQISSSPARLTWLDFLAALVWLVGFYFEAVGDWQMARFKADPANQGQVLKSGLWRYTRHPNYFGEAVMWWAYFLLALATGAYWTVYGSLLMTLLLLRVSGVTLLEKTLTKTKPQYQAYIESTSPFIPWPRRQQG
jgi:steroid 5-alpha reductase family enzyme